MSVPESEVSRFYTILGHPLRRRLIKILGEVGRASFTDLKSTLKVSVGTLYYNLDLLEDLVAQDKSKRYVLIPKGEIAYRLLVESEEKLVYYRPTHHAALHGIFTMPSNYGCLDG